MPFSEVAETKAKAEPQQNNRFLDEMRQDPKIFYSALKANFDAIDSDHSGTLSKLELVDYSKQSTDASGKAAAQIVSEHFDDLKNLAAPQEKRGYGAWAKEELFGDPAQGDAVSRKDVEMFSHSYLDNTEVQSMQRRVNRNMNINGSILAFYGTLYTGALGAAGVLLPELATKIACFGSIPIFAGPMFLESKGYFTAPKDSLFKEAEQRRQMINSWKFFQAR